jgi:hypothetical protein
MATKRMSTSNPKVAAMGAKQLHARFGAREAHRIIADRLCWARYAKRGETPVFTPRPSI